MSGLTSHLQQPNGAWSFNPEHLNVEDSPTTITANPQSQDPRKPTTLGASPQEQAQGQFITRPFLAQSSAAAGAKESNEGNNIEPTSPDNAPESQVIATARLRDSKGQFMKRRLAPLSVEFVAVNGLESEKTERMGRNSDLYLNNPKKRKVDAVSPQLEDHSVQGLKRPRIHFIDAKQEITRCQTDLPSKRSDVAPIESATAIKEKNAKDTVSVKIDREEVTSPSVQARETQPCKEPEASLVLFGKPPLNAQRVSIKHTKDSAATRFFKVPELRNKLYDLLLVSQDELEPDSKTIACDRCKANAPPGELVECSWQYDIGHLKGGCRPCRDAGVGLDCDHVDLGCRQCRKSGLPCVKSDLRRWAVKSVEEPHGRFDSKNIDPAILRVSQGVYQEAMTTLLGRNTFVFSSSASGESLMRRLAARGTRQEPIFLLGFPKVFDSTCRLDFVTNIEIEIDGFADSGFWLDGDRDSFWMRAEKMLCKRFLRNEKVMTRVLLDFTNLELEKEHHLNIKLLLTKIARIHKLETIGLPDGKTRELLHDAVKAAGGLFITHDESS